ncbi:MAG: hypothetical protein RMM58_15960, partial [Chloroflexota bacterium]|nr:hypothetical protein [Chloroflexota bacterium]
MALVARPAQTDAVPETMLLARMRLPPLVAIVPLVAGLSVTVLKARRVGWEALALKTALPVMALLAWRVLLVRVRGPKALTAPPSAAAELLVKVLAEMVAALAHSPPPSRLAELLVKALAEMVAAPAHSPPPNWAELLVKVLAVMNAELSARSPPPLSTAELLVKVLAVMVAELSARSPPPLLLAELLVKVLAVMTAVPKARS